MEIQNNEEGYATDDIDEDVYHFLAANFSSNVRSMNKYLLTYIENKRGFAVDNVFLITHNIDAKRIVTPTGGITLDILFLRLMFLVGVFIL
jgi:hypothetical protein